MPVSQGKKTTPVKRSTTKKSTPVKRSTTKKTTNTTKPLTPIQKRRLTQAIAAVLGTATLGGAAALAYKNRNAPSVVAGQQRIAGYGANVKAKTSGLFSRIKNRFRKNPPPAPLSPLVYTQYPNNDYY
jgi:hypothetical protein